MVGLRCLHRRLRISLVQLAAEIPRGVIAVNLRFLLLVRRVVQSVSLVAMLTRDIIEEGLCLVW